ncbi:snake venom serine protease NaSP-like [Atheta coriaria]|uniref:snake venom serine protease NaSP-like n=1 Tax=Dalotia coriaria TaxID=877792 RepID=UPI0031F3FB20
MKVDLTVFEDDVCEATYNDTMKTNSEIQLCSGVVGGGRGQCSGDSGGPLYADGVQVGVVSWSLKPCAQEGLPGVFTKVSMYLRWINKQIQNSN